MRNTSSFCLTCLRKEGFAGNRVINMKWLKKWGYLILFTATGLVYLAFVDKWQVYAGPLSKLKEWCRELKEESILMADGAAGSWASGDAGGVSSGDGAEEFPGGGLLADGESANGMGIPEGVESGTPAGSGDVSGSGGGMPGDANRSGTGVSGGANGSGTGVPGDANGSGGGAAGDVNGSGGGIPGDANGSGTGVSGGANGSGGGIPGDVNGAGADNSGQVPGNGSATGSGNSGVPGEGNDPSQVKYMTVEDDYFADAVFIGDSRTVGMFEYGGLEEISTFYASTGLTVYKIFDSEIVSVPDERKKISVEEALEQNSFAKIYLMIGINEMGTGTVESFLEKYQEVVNHLRELQPDAVIYLQAIMKVTAERSAQGDYITNEGIAARNEGIAGIADNEKIFFLDVNPLVCDETGGMVPDYTFDGVHLKAKYIQIWKDFLKTHAISS